MLAGLWNYSELNANYHHNIKKIWTVILAISNNDSTGLIPKSKIAGIILAGGKASRMGFVDKPLLPLHGYPIIKWIIDKTKHQVDTLALSVNRNQAAYGYLNLPIIADVESASPGPLVGIVSAMKYFISAEAPQRTSYLACFPADVPYFPENLTELLGHEIIANNADVAFCQNCDQIQPLFSLWSYSTLPKLEDALKKGLYGPKQVFPLLNSVAFKVYSRDPALFLNINSKADLLTAEKLINPLISC